MTSDAEADVDDVPETRQRKKLLKSQSSAKNQKLDTFKIVPDIFCPYFKRDENGVIRCCVTDCKSTVARWQTYFFKRHFISVHPTLLHNLCPEAFDVDMQCKIDICEQMYNAIELVTVNGYPLSILDTPAIHGFLKKQIEELEKNGHKLTLNRHMIVEKVKEISKSIKKRISDELKGKLFSIMFDVCTKRTLSVLGISVTFMQNDTVVARSLGTVQLKERHRGPYMAAVVENTLQDFGASTAQVISATADQASNMDNTTRHLSIRACSEKTNGNSSNDENESAYDSDSDNEAQMELENEIELLNEINNEDRYIELVTEMAESLLRKNNLLSMVHKVHCCAHTVQLAVKDAIKKSNALPILEDVREMMKNLRSTVVNVKFRKLAPNCVLPPMYIDIRWNSDFQMVFFSFFNISISTIFNQCLSLVNLARSIRKIGTCHHSTGNRQRIRPKIRDR